VHLLVIKEFVNIFERHGVSNIRVDMNIFDKYRRLTDKVKFSCWVNERDIN
jgi:hypothetical protein